MTTRDELVRSGSCGSEAKYLENSFPVWEEVELKTEKQ